MIRPWGMVAVLVLGAIISRVPAVGELFVFDRTAVASGELWRLFTCHLVHYSGSHLFWNLAVVVFPGVLLARAGLPIAAGVAATVLVTGPLLFVFEPMMGQFCGLSGIGTLLLAQLIVTRLRSDGVAKTYWVMLALLMLAKFGLELHGADPLLSNADQFVPVPLAHLLGLLLGTVIGFASPTVPERPVEDQRNRKRSDCAALIRASRFSSSS
jgi:rhomboid family GlyGly-CTERM serine protease